MASWSAACWARVVGVSVMWLVMVAAEVAEKHPAIDQPWWVEMLASPAYSATVAAIAIALVLKMLLMPRGLIWHMARQGGFEDGWVAGVSAKEDGVSNVVPLQRAARD